MNANNTWPNANTYVTLTAPATNAATEDTRDNKMDSYVPPPVDIPFNDPQLYATLYATGPLITQFPIAIWTLLDIGCHCTVISLELCE